MSESVDSASPLDIPVMPKTLLLEGPHCCDEWKRLGVEVCDECADELAVYASQWD